MVSYIGSSSRPREHAVLQKSIRVEDARNVAMTCLRNADEDGKSFGFGFKDLYTEQARRHSGCRIVLVERIAVSGKLYVKPANCYLH